MPVGRLFAALLSVVFAAFSLLWVTDCAAAGPAKRPTYGEVRDLLVKQATPTAVAGLGVAGSRIPRGGRGRRVGATDSSPRPSEPVERGAVLDAHRPCPSVGVCPHHCRMGDSQSGFDQ